MPNSKQDKFVGYCAVTPNRKFFKLFKRAKVRNILISYHYIRKDPALTLEILEYVKENKGLFMTDSGVFSFLGDKNFDAASFDWRAYLEEYTDWLHRHSEYVFSACNLDMDLVLGHDLIKEWNEEFFEPLEEKMNIIYVAHQVGVNPTAIVREYAKKYDYIAVNENLAAYVGEISTIARNENCCVHGLAWTKPTLLQDFPFFSVDSSSWVNYQKYGATIWFDGKNFFQYDNKNKDERKNLQKYCKKYGVKHYEYVNEIDEGSNPPKHNDDEGLAFSLFTWQDVFEWLKKTANRKLKVTVGQRMVDKDFQWPEPQQAQVVATDEDGNTLPVVVGGNSLASRLEEMDGVGETELQGIAYQQNEDGSQVAVYKRRDEIVTVDDVFAKEFGNTLFCDTCAIQDKCPKFTQGMACAFNFNPGYMTENPVATLDFLIKAQTERVNRMRLFESIEGGTVNKTLSAEMKLLADLNQARINLLSLMQLRNLMVDGRATGITADNAAEAKEASFANILISMMNQKK